MARRKCKVYSGIGGQAVLEGVMMKNKEKYAVAVRKPDGEISVEVEHYEGFLHGNKIKEIPFLRGIFNFVESLILGTRCLNYSAVASDDIKYDGGGGVADSSGNKFTTTLVTIFSIVFALGLFVVLPYYLSTYFEGFIRNRSLVAIIEGGIRIAIFILYAFGISMMKDIRRLYRYHGAEHKCINCIEKGKPLTVRNVMRSSRLHKRCGTSFMFFVMFVSIILFFFIRVDNPLHRVLLRILLMPVVAGISYELIRLAGRSDNILVKIISLPGMAIQGLTTKEPDKQMIEVAIMAVEAVFDWKQYLKDTFGYEEDESWIDPARQEYIDKDEQYEEYEDL